MAPCHGAYWSFLVQAHHLSKNPVGCQDGTVSMMVKWSFSWKRWHRFKAFVLQQDIIFPHLCLQRIMSMLHEHYLGPCQKQWHRWTHQVCSNREQVFCAEIKDEQEMMKIKLKMLQSDWMMNLGSFWFHLPSSTTCQALLHYLVFSPRHDLHQHSRSSQIHRTLACNATSRWRCIASFLVK